METPVETKIKLVLRQSKLAERNAVPAVRRDHLIAEGAIEFPHSKR